MGCGGSKEAKYVDDSKVKSLEARIKELEGQLAQAKKAATISAAPVTNDAKVKTMEARIKELEGQLAKKGGPAAPVPPVPTAKQSSAPSTPRTLAMKANDVTVLWFPEPKLPCRFYLNGEGCKKNERGQCTAWAHEETNLVKLIRALSSAKKTLDICVFTITCDQISDAVVAAHKKGVKVRVITDNDTAETKGSDIQTFRDAGIPVRQDKTDAHMHHKFAIMDGELLVNGSFNWSRQAVLGNEENIVIMKNKEICKTFSEQFEKMWTKFK